MLNYESKQAFSDKFGHYQIGKFKVHSKIEALEISNKTQMPISWHFNDEVFSAQDWTKEPIMSLGDLYQSRARQIRQNYNHVVLFYSGGADSHNMLESFLHAGLEIDEIASFHSLSADGNTASEFNREIFETAIPFVKNLKSTGRLPVSVPHRLIDMGDIITKFCQDINWLDFPYMASTAISINNVARAHLRKYVADWSNIIDQGKRMVFVWGHDKPRIMSEGNRFFLHFMDIFDNCVSTIIQRSPPPGWFDEMFYNTPDFPEIVIKQSHTIKRFLEMCDGDHSWITESVTGLGHTIKYRPDGSYKNVWLTQDAQSMLIYPWFRPDLYYETKPKDIIYSKRDKWFWKDKKISQNYHQVINGLVLKFGDQWLLHDPTKGIRSTRNFRSKKYWLN